MAEYQFDDFWGSVPDEVHLKRQVSMTDLVTYIEEFWHTNSHFPSNSAFAAEFPGVDLDHMMKSQQFRKMLVRRGVSLPVENLLPDEVHHGVLLTAEQVAAILSVTNYSDTRTRSAKLRELGITLGKFNSWMRGKHFREVFDRISVKNFADGKYLAREGLTRALERGDVSAIKYFNELHNENPVTQNVQLILTRLIEILQLRVKDAETLHSIEQDFRALMGGPAVIEGSPVEEIANSRGIDGLPS